MSHGNAALCRLLVAAALCCSPLAAVMAIDGIVVVQTGRHFAVEDVHVGRGGIIHFLNADDFSHQIYIDSPDLMFESDEQTPGQTVSVTFTSAGVFAVRCHIHPKMHLQVTVSDAG